jgi:hypothetical protein
MLMNISDGFLRFPLNLQSTRTVKYDSIKEVDGLEATAFVVKPRVDFGRAAGMPITVCGILWEGVLLGVFGFLCLCVKSN